MTGKQHAVMWLGFLLIVTRLFASDQWSELWGVVSKRPATGTGSDQGNANPTVPPADRGILGPHGSRPL